MMRIVAVLLALVLGGAGAILASGSANDEVTANGATAVGDVADCGAVHFDHYDAGPEVKGLRKAKTLRRCEPDVGAPTRINMVAALYGSCEPKGDAGCAPPVQVQSWPACERNLALYEKYPGPDGGRAIEYTRTSLRGVPAAIFDGGRRIELYTGDATIAVFGENEGLARAAALRLSGVHDGRIVNEREDLPAPADDAIAGKLAC
jgi:hypothetical protein